MPVIDRQLFAGADKLSEADWGAISAPDTSATAVAKFLEQHGWGKKGAAAVSLRLSPDNTAVEGAKLLLLGNWDKKIQLQARKLFQQAEENVLLEVELPDLGVFRCREGEMWSQYIPQAGIKSKYSKEGREVGEEELREQGIQEFCVRAVTHLSKDCGLKWGMWIQVTVLIFPLSDEAMKALAEDTANPAWPGVKLTEGQIPILPGAGKEKTPCGGKNWGCPITPVLAPGVPWEAAPGPLEERQVASACGALLNKGCVAEALTAIDSLQKRWETLLSNPGLVQEKRAEKLWPAAEQEPLEQATAKKGSDTTENIFKK